MYMQRKREYILEQSREDKIKSLGFLCYNLYVDGIMVFPEMNDMGKDIDQALKHLFFLRKNNFDANYVYMTETSLNEKITELGCVCYNLYVDNKLFNNKVLLLCNSISSINSEIANGWDFSLKCEYPSSCEEPKSPNDKKRNVTQSKLKITCPYGMEPIPYDFKRCTCGYRNKSEARFCGKCGAKLS